jgi:predicted PurR-regulated permease PerM
VRRPERVEAALAAAWRTLSSYVRGLAMVGFIDGALIGVGLAIVGTPLVLPLAVLVFIGGFFPIVGAFVSGLVAVAVSFVNGGAGDAIIVLAIVVGVQQLEGHVLYPIIFKRVLALHPLVILLAIAIGGVAFGIVGAFLSVPLTAVAVSLHEALADDPDTSLVGLLGSRPYETMPIAATPGEDIGDERAGSEG